MAIITDTRILHSLKGTDWQGSVIKETPHSETLVAGFTPFGYLCKQERSNIGFVGNAYEPAAGLYLLGNGYRAYSPTLKRFVATDDLSPFGRGGSNTYAYCAADPTNNTDSDGHALARSLSKLVQKIFRGRKSADKAHLDDKYKFLVDLRGDAQRGLRTLDTLGDARTAANRAVNLKRAGKFGMDVRLTGDERRDLIRTATRGEDIFRDTNALNEAAARVARTLGKDPRPNILGNINFQRRMFDKGTTAFKTRISRYEEKGASYRRSGIES